MIYSWLNNRTAMTKNLQSEKVSKSLIYRLKIWSANGPWIPGIQVFKLFLYKCQAVKSTIEVFRRSVIMKSIKDCNFGSTSSVRAFLTYHYQIEQILWIAWYESHEIAVFDENLHHKLDRKAGWEASFWWNWLSLNLEVLKLIFIMAKVGL